MKTLFICHGKISFMGTTLMLRLPFSLNVSFYLLTSMLPRD
nr:unnamed protein product [Callosobruchus analis]